MPGLELSEWDREQLNLLEGNAGPFEDLRRAIWVGGRKVEQETVQRQILAMFENR
jgi:hypothetical protein